MSKEQKNTTSMWKFSQSLSLKFCDLAFMCAIIANFNVDNVIVVITLEGREVRRLDVTMRCQEKLTSTYTAPTLFYLPTNG